MARFASPMIVAAVASKSFVAMAMLLLPVCSFESSCLFFYTSQCMATPSPGFLENHINTTLGRIEV